MAGGGWLAASERGRLHPGPGAWAVRGGAGPGAAVIGGGLTLPSIPAVCCSSPAGPPGSMLALLGLVEAVPLPPGSARPVSVCWDGLGWDRLVKVLTTSLFGGLELMKLLYT